MYNNSYMRNFNQQNMYDQIDNQINQLQQMREQMKNNATQQPTHLTQNFQLAPNNLGGLRYFNTIDEVDKEMVYNDTPFFSKDMSVLWLKNSKGDIKTYELKEIVPLDDKDVQIQLLQNQLNEVRKELENAKSNNTIIDEPTTSKKSTSVQSSRNIKKK